LSPSAIEVLIHPESLVHALVGFRDGALMAHLGAPTCATPSASR
jgi:1-deoxy-D-xylulose-5-phosphate reductoisomerase